MVNVLWLTFVDAGDVVIFLSNFWWKRSFWLRLKITKFRKALNKFFLHTRCPKLDIYNFASFATLLHLHHKLKIPSQMYPEVTCSIHWDLKRYQQNKTHIATAQNHSHDRLNESSERKNIISFCRVNTQTRTLLQDKNLTAVWSNNLGLASRSCMQHNENSWIHRLQYEGKSIWAVTGLLKTEDLSATQDSIQSEIHNLRKCFSQWHE
jgi:hypothetical protein